MGKLITISPDVMVDPDQIDAVVVTGLPNRRHIVIVLNNGENVFIHTEIEEALEEISIFRSRGVL